MNQREPVTNGKTVNLDFWARSVAINNTSGAWVYVRVGGNDAPNAQNATYSVPPYTSDVRAVQPCRAFGFGVASASGANPVNAQNPIATFYDIEQPAASMNIAQPQSLYAPTWLWLDLVTLAAGSVYTLVNPGASSRVHVFKLLCMGDPTIGNQYYEVYHTTVADVWTVQLNPSATYGILRDELDLLPHGTILPVGATLKFKNPNGGTRAPGVGVLYAVI